MAAVPSIGRATGVESAVAAPEADATRTLYERYGNQIFGYCLHQLGSREEAEDAVQSTFLNAFRGLCRGIVPEAEQAWLFKIAQNVCLSRRRSTWRRGRIESPADFDLAEETTAAPTRRADELIGLQDVLENMPENQRRAILLREWQGLSYREIAEELELSQSAVETLIFRARRALAQGLEASPAEQRSWRARLRPTLDLGALAGWAKSLLASGMAVKAAGTVAVVAVTSAVVAPPARHPHVRHATAPVRKASPAHASVVAAPLALRAAVPPAQAAPVSPKRLHSQTPRHVHVPVAPPAPAAPQTNAVVQAPAAAVESTPPPVPAPPAQPEPAKAATPTVDERGAGDRAHHTGSANAQGAAKGDDHRRSRGQGHEAQQHSREAHAVSGQSDPRGRGHAAPDQGKHDGKARPSGQDETPAGHSQTPSGQAGTPPGQSDTPSGQGHDSQGNGNGSGTGNADANANGSGHQNATSPAPTDPPAAADPPAPADPPAQPAGAVAGNAGGTGNGHKH